MRVISSFIGAALCCCIASASWAQGAGDGAGGEAGGGGGSGGGGGGDATMLCPFPMMPTIVGQMRGPDFCLMNESTPVLALAGPDAGLIPWSGVYPLRHEDSAPAPVRCGVEWCE